MASSPCILPYTSRDVITLHKTASRLNVYAPTLYPQYSVAVRDQGGQRKLGNGCVLTFIVPALIRPATLFCDSILVEFALSPAPPPRAPDAA